MTEHWDDFEQVNTPAITSSKLNLYTHIFYTITEQVSANSYLTTVIILYSLNALNKNLEQVLACWKTDPGQNSPAKSIPITPKQTFEQMKSTRATISNIYNLIRLYFWLLSIISSLDGRSLGATRKDNCLFVPFLFDDFLH